jgi:hypothetical protein
VLWNISIIQVVVRTKEACCICIVLTACHLPLSPSRREMRTNFPGMTSMLGLASSLEGCPGLLFVGGRLDGLFLAIDRGQHRNGASSTAGGFVSTVGVRGHLSLP